MRSDVVQGCAVARSHDSARAALAQRSAPADSERREIVDVIQDRIAQLRHSQNALPQGRLQISHEKSERFGSAGNWPHGEALDASYARGQRIARYGQSKLQSFCIADNHGL